MPIVFEFQDETEESDHDEEEDEEMEDEVRASGVQLFQQQIEAIQIRIGLIGLDGFDGVGR